MNWTAWNSVRANPLASRPSAVPEHGVEDGDDDQLPQRPGDVEAADVDGERRGDEGLQDRHHAEGQGVAEHEVALAHRRREQPLEGARRSARAGWRRS